MDELEELLEYGTAMYRINDRGEKEHIPREKWDKTMRNPKYFIADVRSKYDDYLIKNRKSESDIKFICSAFPEHLMGLELSWNDVVIDEDSQSTFRFWQTLQSRIRRSG